jgi:hypothetical protein
MAFNPTTFKRGVSLGMWSMPTQGTPIQPYDYQNDPRFLGLSKEKQAEFNQRSLESDINAASNAALLGQLAGRQYTLDEIGDYQERQARRAQELGKESLKEAYKYTTLANIPKTIAQSFGNIAAMNVLGARNATEAMAATLQAYPRISPVNIQFQESKYF